MESGKNQVLQETTNITILLSYEISVSFCDFVTFYLLHLKKLDTDSLVRNSEEQLNKSKSEL